MNSSTPPRSSRLQAQAVSPLRSPPPRPSSPPRRRRRSSGSNDAERDPKDKKRAEELAQQLDSAIPIMLDKLFSYLSSLPEEELQESGGLTLPASALGWLASQFYGGDEETAMWASTRDRLRLLRFLLPRVTHLRITRRPWPPPLQSQSNATGPPLPTNGTARARRPPLETFQTTSSSSVCSALTTETNFPTRNAFLHYMELLVDRPSIDLRFFPYLQVLVLDNVPPYWIANFGLVSEKLKILRIDKACLYQLPSLFNGGSYEHLTHLRLNYCGIGELSKLPKLMRKLPNLQFLNLANNELVQERTALRGLAKLGKLTKVDLSGNSLSQLLRANLYLGNVKTLILGGNALEELKGIDKLYGLESLDIGHNNIADVIKLAGLARLPLLHRLVYEGNPFLSSKPPGCESKKASYKQDYRLLMLSWFSFNRDARREDLPVLNNKPMDNEEWESLQTMSSSQRFITGNTTTTTIQRVKRARKHVRKARIGSSTLVATVPKHVSNKACTTPELVVSFSTHDILRSIQQEQQAAFPEDYDEPAQETAGGAVEETKNTNYSLSRKVVDADEQHLTSDKLRSALAEKEVADSSSSPLLMNMDKQRGEVKGENVDHSGQVDTSMEQQLREAVSQLSMSLLVESPMDAEEKVNNDSRGTLKDNSDGSEVAPSGDCPLQENSKQSDNEKTSNTIQLQSGGPAQDDLFGVEWEAIVQLAAAGLIPNGKLRTPVADVPQADQQDTIFATTCDLLPGPHGVDSIGPTAPSDGGSTDHTVDLGSTNLSLAVDNIYGDDYSVPSSLGTNDFPVRGKFQLAEDSSIYDGPDSCRNMNVLKNVDLYFSTFVFRDLIPAPPAAESKEEDWKLESSRYPRIQLWPEDRRSMDTNNYVSPSHQMSDWSGESHERHVRVWEEEIIPCGKSALRRLAPNRRSRLSFHGDQLFNDGVPQAYAESRKVFVCLSSAAIYIISKKDPVTVRNSKKKKKFPFPIEEGASFTDAPWPHAAARHSYRDLKAIAIGFDFQRLTLRFSSSRRSEPFVYVLLTSNKKETVKILQDVQLLAKEANSAVTDLVSDATAVAIENDSQVVFDALNIAVAPDVLGTVLHYQIVQQRWKHGDRGTVRRVCVVTETKLFLLDEDYGDDGRVTLGSTSVIVGEVKFQIVDEAFLPQVAEVQAAGADPRSITIIINPLSRLSRTHRWRLRCRDSNGAERLVEDVRKTLCAMD